MALRDDLKLSGKVALVTGGGSGIGRGILQTLAEEDVAVVVNDIRTEAAAETGGILADGGRKYALAVEDISQPSGAQAAVETAIREFGRLDILVNNAARQIVKNITDMEPAEWDSLMNVNLKAAFLCAKHAIPELARHHGCIINIASVHGHATLGNFAAYAASKAGLLGLTRGMALQCARLGIRVNTVSPGTIDTPLLQAYFDSTENPQQSRAEYVGWHPIGRFGTPADIGNMVAFLASEAASFITGAEIVVDGGMTVSLSSQ